MLDQNALKIFIDGSTYKNPGGDGGIAAIVQYPENFKKEDEEIFKIGYSGTTNCRMELKACIKALEFINDHILDDINRILIVSDSQYVCENQYRVYTWRKNLWRNLNGKPVENKDLWQSFLTVKNKIRIPLEIVWKKGKSSEITKNVDKNAKSAAKGILKPDFGFKTGKIARSKLKGSNTLFPANGQTIIAKICRKLYSDKNITKIFFELFDEEKNEYVGKFYCFADKSVSAELHRYHKYKITLNSDPKMPIVESFEEIK